MAVHRSDEPKGCGGESRRTSKRHNSREEPVNPARVGEQSTALAAVLKGITDGLIALDGHWRCTYVNEAAAAFLQVTPGEMSGKMIWEAFPRLQDSRFHEEFTRAARENVFVKVEDYYEPLGRWYECRCYPTEEGLTVLFSDTTGNKKIEEAMLESRQALEMAVTGSNAGVWRIDLNPEKPGVMPDYIYLSPQLKALIGFANDEFPNSRSAWNARILPEDLARTQQLAHDHAGGRTDVHRVDFRIRHKDGSLRWLSSEGRLYRDEFGRPIRWAGIDWDITDRKRAEGDMLRFKEQAERAAEQARWLARIPEESPNPVLRVSNEHVMLYSNPAAERLCAYWGCWLGQKVPPVVQEIISNALAAEKVTNHEILCGDRTFWLAIAPCPAEDYVNIFARDITDRKQMEESLRQINERLQSSNEELRTQREELETANEELQAQREEMQVQAEELRDQEQALREAHQRAVWLARFPQENPNPVLRVSADGSVLYRNPTAAKLPGWVCEVGQPLPPAALRHLVGKAMAEGRAIHQDMELGEAYYLVGVFPIQAECYANVYGHDITDRKKAEKALQKAHRELEERVQERTAELTKALETLKAERKRFYDVLETLPAYLILLTPDYRVPFANRYFRERFGESHGKRCFEYLFHRTEPCEICDTYKVLKTNAPQRWEWTGPDGHIYDIYDFPFTDVDGSPLIMEMGIDITQRKLAEAALKEANETLEQRVAERTAALQEANGQLQVQSTELQAINEELTAQAEELAAQDEELRTANDELRRHEQALLQAREHWARTFDSVPDLIAVVDDQCQITQVNRAMAERLGVTPEQCVGLLCYKAVHGTDAPPSFCPHTRTLEDGCEHRAEVQEDRLGGDFLVSTTPLHDGRGRMIGSVHVARDISERKRAEEKLARENHEIAMINRILRVFFEETGDDLFDKALQIVLKGMESRHGVFGYVDERGHLLCPSMSKLLAECEVAGKCVDYGPEKWKGLWSRALRGKKTLYTNQPPAVPEGHVPIHNNLASPILFQDRVIGLLNVANKDGGYTEADCRRIEAMADRIAPVLYAWIQKELRENERRQAERDLQRSSERFRLLSETAARLLVAGDPLEVVHDLCRRVMEHLDCHAFFNFVADEKTGQLHLNACAGMSEEKAREIEWLDYGVAVCGCVARDGERIVVEDIPAHPDPRTSLVASCGIQAYACHPLVADGKVIGTLSFGTRTRTHFHEDDLSLMKTVADQVAISMERIRSQQTLRESEQRLRMALEGGRMGLWEWDIERDRSFWDEQVYELLGLDSKTCPATSDIFFSCVDQRDIEALNEYVRKSLAAGSDFHAEYRLARPDGETVWVSVRGKVMRDASGKALRTLGVLYDVTQRKLMEEQLRRMNDQLEEEVQAQTEELRDTVDRLQDEVVRRVLAEGKLRKSTQMLEGFFQHTITPLAFMDCHFHFVRVNEAYARANGKDPKFFKGKNHFSLYPHDENKEIFEQVVQTGVPYRASAKPFQFPDDPQRVSYWDWQLTPLRNERGEVQYLVLNLQDVTEQQAALDELEHRAYQLQKLTLELSQAEDRERKRMAEVLHDGLQQQLAAAKFHLGLLSSRARNDAGMQEIALQLDSLLREAIEQSRSLSHELSPAVLYQSDLGETFEWLARQVQTKHGLTVHTEVHGQVDSRSESIKAFLFRTGQEILFNTVKHAKVDEARLRLQRKGERLWLTITDQGRGFDPETLGRTAGFGLLSIRERVGLLGGRMRIRSAPGKGSTFLIAVPDAQAPEGRDQTAQGQMETAERAGSRRPAPPLSHSSGLRILLVDDHKVMREGLAALIAEQQDMEIVGQAGDGGEAVELTRELQPDVIIMDVAMPVMPGDEATRRIKADFPQMRIIALSMFAESGVREKMLDAGAEAYLAKTGPSEEFLAAIRGQMTQA